MPARLSPRIPVVLASLAVLAAGRPLLAQDGRLLGEARRLADGLSGAGVVAVPPPAAFLPPPAGESGRPLRQSAQELEVSEGRVWDESGMMGMLPAYFMDVTGFDVPKSFPLAVPGVDPSIPVLPLMPVTARDGSLKAVVVPERYLGRGALPKGSTMVSTMPPPGADERMKGAFALVRNAGFTPVFYNNRVIGLPPGTPLIMENVRSFGVSVSLEPPAALVGGKTFSVGDRSGLELVVNPFQPVDQFLENAQVLFGGNRAEATMEQVMKFLPYLQYYLAQNAKPERFMGNGRLFPAVYNSNMTLKPYPKAVLASPIASSEFSPELRRELEVRREKAAREEARWKNRLEFAVAATPVVDMEEGHRLIQQVCDRVVAAYGAQDSAPVSCRISATLVPNAYAYPSGDVFVTAGLVGILSDLDALTYVLGHEVGHVVARHGTKRLAVFGAAGKTMGAASMAGLLFTLTGGAGTLGSVSVLSWLPKAMASQQMAGLGLSLVGMGMNAGLMAYSRDQEWEADRIGQQGALASGADQAAMASGWREFTAYCAQYLGIREGFWKKVFSSHPDSGRRQEQLDARYERYSGLRQRHLDAKGVHRNRLPASFYQDYRSLHATFKPMSERFGRYLKEKARSGEARHLEYVRTSLMAPGGLCVQHALGGGS